MKRHGETQWILTQKTGRNDAFKKGRRKEDRKGTMQRLDRMNAGPVFPWSSTQRPIWSRGFARFLAWTGSCLPWAEVRALGPCPEGPAGPATSPPALRLQSYVQSFRESSEAPRPAQPLDLCSCCLDILPSSFTLPTAGPKTRACKQIINLGKLPLGAGTTEELNREVGEPTGARGPSRRTLVRRVTGSRVCVSDLSTHWTPGKSLCYPALD